MRRLLLPFSLIYAAITSLRNLLFDKGILSSVRFRVPIICVGNITVGGTGKTPCIEYLVQLTRADFNPGLISRGYRRKTKGVVMANSASDASEIGDEPFQIKQRFPAMPIVVAEKRVDGINHLLQNSNVNLILMDDGFQHRAVEAGVYIMMMDYNRPLWNDFTFPAGNMRESAAGRKRADIIIVSKCPPDLTEETKIQYINKLKTSASQEVYFTTIKYGKLESFSHHKPLSETPERIIAVSGIANPVPYINHLKSHTNNVQELSFGDHHNFTSSDIELINRRFAEDERNSIVVVTQKDVARLTTMDLGNFAFMQKLYILPIEMEFLFNEKTKFDKIIKHYVGKNQ